MSDRECPGGLAVVVLPDEIDMLNADSVGERLCAAIVSGAAVVIADLSVTTFCDCTGVYSLLLAHREASARNAELRLAVPSWTVRRILALLEADQVLPVYPDLGAAVAARPAPTPPGACRLAPLAPKNPNPHWIAVKSGGKPPSRRADRNR
jgi:anti-anti-sigma factor